MRTSRIAKEAAKIAELNSPTHRRLTRSAGKVVKNESRALEGTDSELSDVTSVGSFDIEDQFEQPPSKKRKRGADSLYTTATSVTASTTSRTSLGKAGVKVEELNEHKVKKAKRQPAKEVVLGNGEVSVHPPGNWEKVYRLTQEMRKENLAPVDTMGCESIAEDHRSLKDRRFQTLISLMLSSQTKDTTNALVMRRLQSTLKPSFNLESIRALPPDELNELIFPVGFHNNKTRYIKAAVEILHEKYKDDIPDTIEGLISLPGVGPKMAYLCMSSAWGKDEGIGVDVHVHRITNLWGWHKTKNPEETRLMLQSWLPREKWHEINHLLVGFGQTICAPVGRKCGECKLAERGLCPSAVVEKKKVARSPLKGKKWLVEQKETRADEEELKAEGAVKLEANKDVAKIKQEVKDVELVNANQTL